MKCYLDFHRVTWQRRRTLTNGSDVNTYIHGVTQTGTKLTTTRGAGKQCSPCRHSCRCFWLPSNKPGGTRPGKLHDKLAWRNPCSLQKEHTVASKPVSRQPATPKKHVQCEGGHLRSRWTLALWYPSAKKTICDATSRTRRALPDPTEMLSRPTKNRIRSLLWTTGFTY